MARFGGAFALNFRACVLKEGSRDSICREAAMMAGLVHTAVAPAYAVLEPEPGSQAALKGNVYLVLPELGLSLEKLTATR